MNPIQKLETALWLNKQASPFTRRLLELIKNKPEVLKKYFDPEAVLSGDKKFLHGSNVGEAMRSILPNRATPGALDFKYEPLRALRRGLDENSRMAFKHFSNKVTPQDRRERYEKILEMERRISPAWLHPTRGRPIASLAPALYGSASMGSYGDNGKKNVINDIKSRLEFITNNNSTATKRVSTGDPAKAWFPQGIDPNEIPISPATRAWKGNGLEPTQGSNLFASGLPSVAAGYRQGHVRIVRPHHVEGGFPKFDAGGAQILPDSKGAPFYTPHLTSTRPDDRIEYLAKSPPGVFTEKALRDYKHFEPYNPGYIRTGRSEALAKNPAYEMVFATKPGVSIKPRFSMFDGKMYPAIFRPDPVIKARAESIRKQFSTPDVGGLYPHFGVRMKDLYKSLTAQP